MSETVSERLLDQRLRHRMIEERIGPVEWEESLAWGAGEYFNELFDFFPDAPPLPSNSALTEAERAALTEVLALMNLAADATPHNVTEGELLASGWPARIKPSAEKTLVLMMERGRFSEEAEERLPSDGPTASR